MLIAIDASVNHGDALAAGSIDGAKLIMIDPRQNAVDQITQAIHRSNRFQGRFQGRFNSLHIVTHGSPGCLHFSSADLKLDNLHTYAAQIESWFSYRPLAKGSTVRVQSAENFLSLYACSLAVGDAGEAFLEKLQFLTGVSVHASAKPSYKEPIL